VTSDNGWSSPSHYSGGELFEPRTFAEADPVPAVALPEWEAPDEEEERWGRTTFVGARRHRPKPVAAPPETPAEPDDEPVPIAPDKRLLASSKTMAIASLASRVTGFLRSTMLVAALGIAAVGSAYNAGNNLPNMVYELLLGGVLSSVLIPLLVHAQVEDDDEGMAYTQRLLSIAAVALGIITVAAVAAAPLIAGFFVAPGAQRHLTTEFATLLLPEIFFYGLGALFTAVLNVRHVYGPGAWAPVLNNVIMIVTIVIFWVMPGPATLNLATITTAQVLVLGIGTTLGIAAQALVLIPFLRRAGFRWHWRFRARPNEIGRMREVGTLAGWVLCYVVASQIGVSVIQKVGLAIGGFSVFTQVDLLFQMPYGILVVSLLTAIMPRLSRAAVSGDNDAVIADLSLGARMSAIALVPITVGLMALGVPLAITLFAYGQTSLDGARLIGSSLAWSAFGLLAFAVVMLQLRVFYAMRDGRTPTLINIFMVGTKIVLVLVTSSIYAAPPGTNVNVDPPVRAVQWLNISTSASYVIGAIVGHILLTRSLGRLGFRAVGVTTLRIAVPSAVAGLVAYGVVRLCNSVMGVGHAAALTGLVGGAVAGLAVLVLLLWRIRIKEIDTIVATARRR
jgi:putative peptidoglycan lipid II flippase